ncbi:DNA-processing protein DprA [Hyphomonas sp. WL0036]|uniref:DNA-processing protein DprA n=1 Tax=Hyphomonas sediminis TaxID=2866160 RepID=UPI001C7E2086|nr:DNA-processing protein DprA [Hyphomonas sediminis]MBY9067093.1 DNA-processing protein DprA [Hyphomonas sediminis]
MTLPRPLSDAERLDWLRLARTQNVGPVSFAQLIARYGDAGKALAALPEIASRVARGKSITIPPTDQIAREIEAAARYGAQIVASCEPAYPALLRLLDPPPPVLTLLGKASLAAEPTCAIVGARNASAAGRKIARDMAAALGKAGYVTVSGLALGIDGEAHAASLASGTIAVLGGGIDHVYPGQHDRLYAAIAEQGLILSEMPFGHRARAQDFPRRNRIITGLARGTVVVEAAERSGSLISARMAGEQGREVMAVPGSPLDPRSAGTNNLIRNGAALVRDARDVIEVLSSLPLLSVSAPPSDWLAPVHGDDAVIPASELARVREALSPHAMPLDEIARAAGVSAARAGAILMELELAGEALTYPGGLASRSV